MSLESYASRLAAALKSVHVDDVSRTVDLFRSTADSDKTIWIMGNGGSAATANHAAIDFLKTSALTGKSFRAHSLVANSSILTAIANDNSNEEVFALQIRNLAKSGDLVVSISASGNSPNLIRGVEEATRLGCSTFSLLGFDGGALQRLSNFTLLFQTQVGDYGIAEDSHSIFFHYLNETLRASL